MLKEVDLFGVYISPFITQLLTAIVAYGLVRCLYNRLELWKYVWHRALFDAAVFTIILGIVVTVSFKV